jgi:hypothetical protein
VTVQDLAEQAAPFDLGTLDKYPVRVFSRGGLSPWQQMATP